MRVCKHGCDITRILIGYVLSGSRFDWLVGNVSLFQEVKIAAFNFPLFVELLFACLRSLI